MDRRSTRGGRPMASKRRRPRYPRVDRRIRRLSTGAVSIHYFYRPLGLVGGRLPAPDDPRFELEYATRAQQFRDRNAPRRDPRTIGDLKTLFRASVEWAALSKSQR